MLIYKQGFTTFAEAKAEADALMIEAVQVLTASNVYGGVARRMEDSFSRRQDEFHAKCNLFYMQAADDADKQAWMELNNNVYNMIQQMRDHQQEARKEKVYIKTPKKFY